MFARRVLRRLLPPSLALALRREWLVRIVAAERGYREGDIELLSRVSRAVTVPIVASGGAGSARDVVDAFILGGADAALLAGVLHDGTTDIRSVKSALQAARIPVRAAA